MIALHDAVSLREHCRAWGVDPGVGARLARAVLRHGRSLDEAAQRLPSGVPSAWHAAFSAKPLELRERADSQLDGSSKLVFQTANGARIESVLLRIASGRNGLCLSIQSRCPVACRFCASGTLGKPQSLSIDEVLEQVVRARQILRAEGATLRNLVFMGMGEPLIERELLFATLRSLTDPHGFAFPEKRIVVSTVGLPDAMVELSQRFPGVRQALSLHSARQEVRALLIPLARKHTLAELRRAVAAVTRHDGAQVFVEVLLLEGVTDRAEDLDALCEWAVGLPILLNLIPFNRPGMLGPDSTVDRSLAPTPMARCIAIAAEMRARGLKVTLRHSLGADISAACGQLAARLP